MLSEVGFKTPVEFLIVFLSSLQMAVINSSPKNHRTFVSEIQYSYYLSVDTSLNVACC